MSKIIKLILKPVDYVLNRVTMYRLLLYFLSALITVAGILGIFKLMPYGPLDVLFSTMFMLSVCWVANRFFSYMFSAPTNVESVYLTALILVLIITPIAGLSDAHFFALATWASVWAMASKYLFTIHFGHSYLICC